MKVQKSVAEIAHQVWACCGRPHGSVREDWLEARRLLMSVESAESSAQGAYDPPASTTGHLPELP